MVAGMVVAYTEGSFFVRPPLTLVADELALKPFGRYNFGSKLCTCLCS